MKKVNKYTRIFWNKLASQFSGEDPETKDFTEDFRRTDNYDTEKYWKELGTMSNNKKIDIDKAWNNVKSRIEENGLLHETSPVVRSINRKLYLRIAAAAVLLIGLSAVIYTTFISGNRNNYVTFVSGADERNITVTLPDGSTVWLNRNSKLIYSLKMDSGTRNVKLTGEAFFNVVPDTGKPFVIEAGNGRITVVGTTFNVISNNNNNDLEVYVKTGRVLLSDDTGNNSVILEPEYVGILDNNTPDVKINEDLNYLSWRTDLLVFVNKKLSVVINDLNRVYNINITTDDPEILDRTLTTTWDKEPQDTIMDIICTTFTLSYKKDGNNYHLSKR